MIASDRNNEVFPEGWTGKLGLYDENGKQILANEYEYLGFIGNLGVASKSKVTQSVNQVLRAGEYNEWGEIESEFPLGEFNRLHFPSGPFTLFSPTAKVMSVENAVYPALQMDEEMMEDRFCWLLSVGRRTSGSQRIGTAREKSEGNGILERSPLPKHWIH